MSLPAFLEARRSIRAFTAEPVTRDALDALVEAACVAPAPHHSRPWRFVVVDSGAAKRDLATGMGDRWRSDLAADGVDPARVDELVDASHRKLAEAPALVLGCLTWDGLDRYPDADAPTGRVGHGPAVARRGRREPHAGRGRRTGSRRAGSPRRSSAPRPRVTRSPCPRSGYRTRSCSSAIRTRATSGAPDRRSRSTISASFADRELRQAALGPEPLQGAAHAVIEVGPRLPAQMDLGPTRVER